MDEQTGNIEWGGGFLYDGRLGVITYVPPQTVPEGECPADGRRFQLSTALLDVLAEAHPSLEPHIERIQALTAESADAWDAFCGELSRVAQAQGQQLIVDAARSVLEVRLREEAA